MNCTKIIDAVAPKSKALAIELESLLPRKTHRRQRALVVKLCASLCSELGGYYEERERTLRRGIASMLEAELGK